MNLTIQILTKNNEKTIEKAIHSLLPLDPIFQIIDLGSTDRTTLLIKNLKIKYLTVNEKNRSQIRNHFKKEIKTQWFMWIHPWEAIIKGYEFFNKLNKTTYKVKIFQDQFLYKESRLWLNSLNYNFHNPIFETVDCIGEPSDISLYSIGDQENNLPDIQEWKRQNPLSPDPYYYEACALFAKQQHQEFFNVSERYMFLEQKAKISTVMHRYYYALANVYHSKNAKLALQNLAICLATNPLMAEFWCLAGDIYLFLSKFNDAILFYQNAINLGKHRDLDDDWPMDISKYLEYPEKMIKKCKNFLLS